MAMKFNVFDIGEFEPHGSCNVAAAAVSAVGSLGGALFGSSAAGKAASAQQAAAQAAIAAQQRMFEEAKGELQPFINAGSATLPQLQSWLSQTSGPLASLLKLTTPGADMTSTLEQTPGFQFANQYGQKAVQNSLAARGLGGPGGALAKGGAQYAEGLAGNTWQSVVNALQNTFSSGANSLQNLVNTGQGAASSLAGGAIQTGQGISNNLIGSGNAQAAGTIGQANALAGGLTGLAGSGNSYLLMSKLLGGQGGGLYGGGDPTG